MSRETGHLPLVPPPCLVECERCGCVVDLNDKETPTTLLADGWGDFEKVPVCPTCGRLLA